MEPHPVDVRPQPHRALHNFMKSATRKRELATINVKCLAEAHVPRCCQSSAIRNGRKRPEMNGSDRGFQISTLGSEDTQTVNAQPAPQTTSQISLKSATTSLKYPPEIHASRSLPARCHAGPK